jgi:hypothetical protein
MTVTTALLVAVFCSAANWPQYDANPFVIPLEIPAPGESSAGGILVADLTGDGLIDYLVTVPGHVAAYAHDGSKLWVHQVDVRVGGSSESEGLPGHHGPGVAVATVQGKIQVLYLTNSRELHAVDAATGALAWKASPPVPEGAERWEHLAVGNFRGRGDRDLLLQATNKAGYRMGRYLAAYPINRLRQGNYEPLWTRDDFLACAHNGARLADLDGDGKDEVLGGMILNSDGTTASQVPLKGHIDSVFAYDVRPDLPGIEVVTLEEGGGNRVFLSGKDGLVWETHYQHWEPQNAAVGNFDPEREGLQIWCRSRFNEHQKPFVFDAHGELIAHYEMDDVAPEGWTASGVELIYAIDWTGAPAQQAAATERHMKGDVCVFDPISGKFLHTIKEKADRLHVADVSGDWREEILVLHGNELRIYHNAAPNDHPRATRLWDDPNYRKAKHVYNYYSP